MFQSIYPDSANSDSGANLSYNTLSNVSRLTNVQKSFSVSGVSNFNSNSSASNTNKNVSEILKLFKNSSTLRNSFDTEIGISSNSTVGTYNNQSNNYLSEVEAAILRSSVPICLEESEEITVLGERGIWTNKAEVTNWKGNYPINDYKINEDQSPEIIRKKTVQNLTYIQELAIRYLKPPTPSAPGDIIIKSEKNTFIPPAPPLIIRQQPNRPETPEPLVIREAPPVPPQANQVGRKVITISGKRLPPPPRKVVIERLPPLPSKPQSVLIERWLPYNQVKRRVIYQKTSEREPIMVKPKNVIVQWEAPNVTIKKDFKYLGIIRANPEEYVRRYGPTLKTINQLPDFVLEIKPPNGIVLAADYQFNSAHELEGDLQALEHVDLDREGLSEYKPQLEKLKTSNHISQNKIVETNSNSKSNSIPSKTTTTSISYFFAIIDELFSQINKFQNDKITYEEAEIVLFKLNSRLTKKYSDNDLKNLLIKIFNNQTKCMNLFEFKIAFERIFKTF